MFVKDNTKADNFFGEQFLVGPKYRITRHLIFSVGIILLSYWEMKDIYLEGSRWFPVMQSSVMTLLVVYLNIYVLAPQFLLKRWYGVYLLTVAYAILLAYFVEMLTADMVYLKYNPIIRELYGRVEISPVLQMFTSVTSLGILMISSSALVLFRKWMTRETHLNALEKTAVQAELKQLKMQTNPHFLIQLLDRASLSATESKEEASAILLELGSVLRYQLYDSARESVLLSADIQFLTNFLNLEKKCHRDFQFTVKSEGGTNNCLIPSLLFIPIVEQAIAKIPDNDSPAFVNLDFRVNGTELTFECRSLCTKEIEEENVGFDSIHRRLTLLYGHLYTLEKTCEETTCIVRLRLHQTSFFKEKLIAS